MKRLDAEYQHGKNPAEKKQTDNFDVKKVPPQQVAGSEFSIPTPFVFRVITEGQKRIFNTDAIYFTGNFI